jgi:Zn-dependent protease with chaperone function
MKALEQFFHFCIVCWSLAGIGVINSALNFPPDEYQGTAYFIFFIVLGFIGNKISGVVYYGIKSYLSIILSIFFYLPIIIGLLFINQILLSLFIFILSMVVTNKLLSKNQLKWKNIYIFRFYLRSFLEVKKSMKNKLFSK